MSDNTAEKKTAAEPQKPTGPPKGAFRENIESFIVTLIMALFGMTFVLQAVTVPTASMENSILVGDYLLVNKFIFSPGDTLPFLPQREIQRGDIIVFKYPGNSNNPRADQSRGLRKYEINYVKRVIGLPGETVEFKNNQVFINGNLLPEHRVGGDHPTKRDGSPNALAPLETTQIEERQPGQTYDVYYGEDTMAEAKTGKMSPRGFEFGGNGKPYTIPADNYFVMGDNRDNSEDSRVWGTVHRDLVIGRAMFVYWSCDQTQSESMMNCITSPRLNRLFRFIK